MPILAAMCGAQVFVVARGCPILSQLGASLKMHQLSVQEQFSLDFLAVEHISQDTLDLPMYGHEFYH